MSFAPASPPILIELPKSTFPGNRTQEGRGILTNCYAEPNGEDGDVKHVRAPGLVEFGTTTHEGFRGHIAIPGALFAVTGQKVMRYSGAGGAGTELTGTVSGEAPVIMARNNATVSQVVIVAPGDGVYLIVGNTVVPYPDSDVGQPNSVSIFKSFFIFTYGDGTVRSSDPGSTNINTLNFATAEYKPDALYRSVSAGGSLLLMGAASIEEWGGSANDTGFPFSFMRGIDLGLLAPYAVAGYQDGFSGGIVLVGSDFGVHSFRGGSLTKISPPDLDRLIADTEVKSSIEVMAFMSNGHPFIAVQSDDWSWVFDLNTLKWHIRKSYLATRWRATQAVFAFDKWIVGDRVSSGVDYLDAAVKTEVGEPLRYTIETGPQKNFPMRMRVNRVHVLAAVGVGVVTGDDPIETNPTIEIEFSGDGGLNWTAPRQRSLGRQAIARTSINANNFGHASGQGARWRFSVSDPADVSIMGASMEVRELAA